MKFQKYVYLISILKFVFILQGCSHTVGLSTSPSDFVLHSIKPNNKDVVKYELRTRLSEPYTYKDAGKYKFYIGNSLIDNIEIFLFTKFNKVSKDLDDEFNVFIKIIFDSFEIDFYGPVGYEVEMTISVEVTRNGREFSKKEIHSKYANIEVAEAVNGTTNKFIIMLDKYLLSLGL